MRNAHKNQPKSHNDHPIFLVDDDSQESRAYCYACTQYEEDINLLQQKLMETHNKLIEQIDICREQEIRIIQLGKRSRQRDEENDNNVGNRQKSGKIYKKYDKNDEEYLHSIQPLIEAKTQHLRNNLQQMRAKVLSEITKSNKLKQEKSEIVKRHDKELLEYRDKIHKLELSRNKLVDENEKLREEILVAKKAQNKVSSKCVCGFEQKYYELDKAFMNQRTVTNQLIQENNRLQNKIHSIYQGKAKGHYDNDHNDNRQEIHTEPRRKKAQPLTKEKYKQEFEATKNLIKKLEEAQLQIRNKNKA